MARLTPPRRVEANKSGRVQPGAAPDAPTPEQDHASAAGLLYVCGDSPGYRRLRHGKGFRYVDANGRPLRDPAQLERIRKLAIPPAYEQVWICGSARGHLQATGLDARGRKQYRYHPDWSVQRAGHKFERMLAFGRALPRIRARVERDLPRGPAQPTRDAVLAAVVRLLDTTFVRVGNAAYTKANGSYGLTTLKRRHAALESGTLTLRFKGKGGIQHDIRVGDRRVVQLVRRCQHLPGQALFHYLDEAGEAHCIGSSDVNAYLAEAAGATADDHFTAKDFRTWHGSARALELADALKPETPLPQAAARQQVNQLLADVAGRLGNTVAVCRKAYVHPGILVLAEERLTQPEPPASPDTPSSPRGLSAVERRLMAFLKTTLQEAPASSRRRAVAGRRSA